VKILPTVLLTLALAGCQTAAENRPNPNNPQPTDMGWSRLDGRSLASNPQLQAQFQYDATLCKADTDKVALSAGPIYYQGIVGMVEAHMINEKRNETLRSILMACMLQKGYQLTTRAEFEQRQAARGARVRSRQ
jgi:hypothetical protein